MQVYGVVPGSQGSDFSAYHVWFEAFSCVQKLCGPGSCNVMLYTTPRSTGDFHRFISCQKEVSNSQQSQVNPQLLSKYVLTTIRSQSRLPLVLHKDRPHGDSDCSNLRSKKKHTVLLPHWLNAQLASQILDCLHISTKLVQSIHGKQFTKRTIQRPQTHTSGDHPSIMCTPF